MRDQCAHILEALKLAHVSLVLLPCSAGGHIGLEGACTIVERNGSARIVNLTDLADGRVSDGNGGACVEACDARAAVAVRNTTGRNGVMLTIPVGAWREFTSALK